MIITPPERWEVGQVVTIEVFGDVMHMLIGEVQHNGPQVVTLVGWPDPEDERLNRL